MTPPLGSRLDFIQIRDHNEVRILTLSRPKANALNSQMVDELTETVRSAQADDAVRAVVVASSQPGFFSAGFDVNEVFGYDPPAMRVFFLRFVALYERLLRLPKPVIGALTGHTVAGGAFLALACDMRVMAAGDYAFAVNEINFGAIVPSSVRQLLIDTIGPHQAARMILTGDAVKPKQALEIGLVDDVVAETDVLVAAMRLAHELAAKPSGAFGSSKRALHADCGHLLESDGRDSIDEFLDQWFSPECAERRRALTTSLKKQ